MSEDKIKVQGTRVLTEMIFGSGELYRQYGKVMWIDCRMKIGYVVSIFPNDAFMIFL